jgi:predicted secreted protein
LLVLIAGLTALLLLAGCADQMETRVVLQPDGAWTGEARLTFIQPRAAFPAWQTGLDARVEERARSLLKGSGIRYQQLRSTAEGNRAVYTWTLAGQEPDALAGLLATGGAVAEGLSGPIDVEVSGEMRAGQEVSVALPASPSTGYGWTLVPDAGSRVAQLGEVSSQQLAPQLGALARQAIRLKAAAGGSVTVRLHYRRPWQPDEQATRSFQVWAPGQNLGSVLAGLSMPAANVAEWPRAAAGRTRVETEGAHALLSYFNWCDQGGCTPIRDQGACGSCWAFGTVGVLEQAIRIDDGVSVDLSEQYLVSCNHDGYGCDGGFWSAHDLLWNEYYWPETQPGAVPEAQFPYVAWDAPCGGPYSHPYRIGSWSYVRPGNPYSVPTVDELKQAMYNYGPIGVSICVGPAFQGYVGGVFMTDESAECGGNSNHAVVLVGWNDAEQSWKLRNSWGTGWGESGTMRIRWGTSVVGYAANYVSYPPFGPPDEFVYLPVVLRRHSSAPPAGIPNGDFEAGHTAWVEYSTHGWNVITTQFPGGVTPHSGSWATWHGGDYNDESYIQQQVTVPYGTSYLAYYHWISSADACGYDYAYIQVNGSTVRRYDLCSPVNTGGWVRQTLSLGAYAGQSVSLRIRVTTDGSLNSNLFVDDVTWAASTAGEPSLPARIDPGDTARRR